eukprot:Gb_03960 [translate_table: standard]
MLFEEFRPKLIYRVGKKNVVEDALSRISQVSSISLDEGTLRKEIADAQKVDKWYQEVLQAVENGEYVSNMSVEDGILWYNNRIVVPEIVELKYKILFELHDIPMAGHLGFLKTYQRVKQSFYWDGLKKDTKQFVVECEVCQRNKGEMVKTPGLLQPLPIPYQRWEEVFVDFSTGLPNSQGKDAIFVVVDKLTKYAHFCRIQSNSKASEVAKIFLKEIHRLHGLSKVIISDCDPKFTSKFWTELFRMLGTKLAISFAYHPQTDGQTEAINKCLEGYMRSYASDKQAQWCEWLPLAEWWYNTTYHTSTKMTPFQALYGYEPPSIKTFLTDSPKIQAVESHIQQTQEVLRLLKENL